MNRLAITSIPPTEMHNTVANYWNTNIGWDWNRLQHLLLANTLDKLAGIIIVEDREAEDTIGWRNANSDVFTVNFAYDIASSISETIDHTGSIEVAKRNAIWKLKIPSRIKTFLWLVRHEKITTNSMRVRRGITDCDKCMSSADKVEDVEHVPRNCPLADEVWKRILSKNYTNCRGLPFREWLDHGIKNKGNGNRPYNDNTLFAVTL